MGNSHPDYHQGFYDAQTGEPIWIGECSPMYAAGWTAFWDCWAIVQKLAAGDH